MIQTTWQMAGCLSGVSVNNFWGVDSMVEKSGYRQASSGTIGVPINVPEQVKVTSAAYIKSVVSYMVWWLICSAITDFRLYTLQRFFPLYSCYPSIPSLFGNPRKKLMPWNCLSRLKPGCKTVFHHMRRIRRCASIYVERWLTRCYQYYKSCLICYY